MEYIITTLLVVIVILLRLVTSTLTIMSLTLGPIVFGIIAFSIIGVNAIDLPNSDGIAFFFLWIAGVIFLIVAILIISFINWLFTGEFIY